MKLIDRRGERFGRLLVVERGPNACGRLTTWTCQCDCGERTTVPAVKLVTGRTRSCGCLARELIGARSRTNGATVGRVHTPEYRVWSGMLGRCRNAADPNYGGRGIAVCQEWANDFRAFLAYMGPRPSSKHSIDRLNPNRGYEPGNCRWATTLEQAQTKRDNVIVEDGDSRVTLSEYARTHGLDYHRLYRFAVTKGRPFPEAVQLVKSTIPRSGRGHTHCHRGHLLTPENVRLERTPSGFMARQCRTCDLIRVNRRSAIRRERARARAQ